MDNPIASHFQANELSVNVSESLVKADRDSEVDDLAPQLSAYSHLHSAEKGFDSAEIAVNLNRDDFDGWLLDGLGRDVDVSGPEFGGVWNGFVNVVRIKVGGLTITRGPLVEVMNDGDMVYSTVDTSTTPPTVGNRTRYSDVAGVFVEDADSQRIHGIWKKVLSTGGLASTAEALDILGTYVQEHRWPETSQQFSSDQGGAVSLQLECLGYWAWLTYPYNDKTAGDIAISDKLIAVLGADPNGIISADYSRITPNTEQVSQWEDEDREAWTIIKALMARGDGNLTRHTFGIFEDRVARYTPAPGVGEIAYIQYVEDTANRIYTANGEAVVYPWNVRPAQSLFYGDILTELEEPRTLDEQQRDPRFEFLENFRYTAPFSFAHDGRKQGRLKQTLSRYGLTGVGA
jgi:hypothetical protein